WDADYLRWQLGAHSGALRLVAYDGTKLVASVFCTPYSLRVDSCVFAIGLGGLLTVDPEYRHGRLTLRMIEAMRQHQKESGLAVLIGVSLDDPGSVGNRFWDFYAKAFPQNFRYLFPVSLWGKVLAPEIAARASIHRWERLLIRTEGRLIHFLPRDRHPEI